MVLVKKLVKVGALGGAVTNADLASFGLNRYGRVGGEWRRGEEGVVGLGSAHDGSMSMANGQKGLFGDCESSADFCGREVDGDGRGVGGENVGSGGEADGKTCVFAIEVGVIALAVGECGELEEFRVVVLAGKVVEVVWTGVVKQV